MPVARFAEPERTESVAAAPVDEPVASVSYFVGSVLVVVAAAGELASRAHNRKVACMQPSAAVLAVGHSGVGPSARVFAASVMSSVQFVFVTAVVDPASKLGLGATVAVGFAVFAAESEDDPAFEPSLLAVLVSVSAAAVGLGQFVLAVVTSHRHPQQE